MRLRFLFIVGVITGYILGARAGRGRYEKIKATANDVWEDPRVKKAVADTQDFVKENAPIVADKVSEGAKVAGAKVVETAKGVGDRVTGASKDAAANDDVPADDVRALTDTFTLANGVAIPKLGFGTWQIPNGDQAYDAVTVALKAGYRHIDTARAYGNEASVGRAIRDSGISRDEIFVTTKLPAEVKDYDEAKASFETTIAALEMDFVDLYLIHAPWPWDEMGEDYRAGNIAAWRAMEEILAAGRARSIGVSNFTVEDIESLVAGSDVTPQVNQIRYFVGYTQDETTAYCQANDILVEGYSPLATGAILDNADVKSIADKYGRSVAQLCIRYLLQRDVLPLPKSTTPSRIAENADVDFTIADDDMTYLDGLVDTTA